MIDCDPILRARKSTVLFHPGWHKGVIGIVASRLIEKYYRPTIVLTRSGNTITGSARSVRGFDLHNAISACADLLEQFGGHKYAAGLTLKEENLETFTQRFEEEIGRANVRTTDTNEHIVCRLMLEKKKHIKNMH